MAASRPKARQPAAPEVAAAGAPELEVAEVDVLVERADLGPGAHTLVVAGEPIPAELADLPRTPREPEPGGDG